MAGSRGGGAVEIADPDAGVKRSYESADAFPASFDVGSPPVPGPLWPISEPISPDDAERPAASSPEDNVPATQEPPPQGPDLAALAAEQARVAGAQRAVRTAPRWAIHEEVAPALMAMWNSDFAVAEETLKRSGRHRLLPRNALHLAEMFILIECATGREEDKERVLDYLKTTEIIAAKILDNKEDFEAAFSLFSPDPKPIHHLSSIKVQPGTGSFPRRRSVPAPPTPLEVARMKTFKLDVEVCYADALLFRGIFQIMMGREIKGAFNLRKSWKLYLRLASELSAKRTGSTAGGPKLMDDDRDAVELCVSFGVAFFQLVMSIVPPTFSSVLKAIGFAVDREAGSRTLLRVFQSRCVRSPVAAMILLMN
ncbi:hypothetical protein HK101_006336, partial [Irineochytrium annulatum]